MKSKFYVIGHRGACAYAPENAMSSFDKAMSLNVDGLETDIRKTRDGILVLFHDNILDKKSNLTGAIQDYSYKELRKADFGSWFSHEFSGEHIVRLDEFLSCYGSKVHLSLEIKAAGIEDLLLEEVNKVNLHKEDYMITSFDLPSLINVKKLDQKVKVGYLTGDCSRDSVHICLDNRLEAICPKAGSLYIDDVEYAHEHGLFVRAWGVGNTDLMKRAYHVGVDGMTIDFPDRLIDYIDQVV